MQTASNAAVQNDAAGNLIRSEIQLRLSQRDWHVLSPATTAEERSAIGVLYTGGTLGMVPGERGLQPGGQLHQRLLDQLQQLPQARYQALPDFDLLNLKQLIDSSNALPQDWLNLQALILSYRRYYRAFIIIHGTDTLAYTASALSFLLPAELPVLVTGSQLPLEADNSDAGANIEATLLAAQQLIRTGSEAAASGTHLPACKAGLIVFGGRILQGNRASKVSTYSPQAFDSSNRLPLGRAQEGQISFSPNREPVSSYQLADIALADARAPLAQVVILKLWPGIQAQQIHSLLAAPVQGVVLESYGSGNAPDLNLALLSAFKAATDRGVVIVNRSQCPQGPVNMDYAAGSALADAGIVSAFDMTCEAAFCKLTLLLSSGLPAEQVKAAFQRNCSDEFSV